MSARANIFLQRICLIKLFGRLFGENFYYSWLEKKQASLKGRIDCTWLFNLLGIWKSFPSNSLPVRGFLPRLWWGGKTFCRRDWMIIIFEDKRYTRIMLRGEFSGAQGEQTEKKLWKENILSFLILLLIDSLQDRAGKKIDFGIEEYEEKNRPKGIPQRRETKKREKSIKRKTKSFSWKIFTSFKRFYIPYSVEKWAKKVVKQLKKGQTGNFRL